MPHIIVLASKGGDTGVREFLDAAGVMQTGGLELKSGQYAITAARDACVRRAAAASEGDGLHAHPIFAFVMALNGLGESVADVYARVGAALEDGPVLASCRIDYDRPLLVGETYRVSGRIAGLVAKSSRRFGQTRHMTQHVDICDQAGRAARVELTAVIPWKNKP